MKPANCYFYPMRDTQLRCSARGNAYTPPTVLGVPPTCFLTSRSVCPCPLAGSLEGYSLCSAPGAARPKPSLSKHAAAPPTTLPPTSILIPSGACPCPLAGSLEGYSLCSAQCAPGAARPKPSLSKHAAAPPTTLPPTSILIPSGACPCPLAGSLEGYSLCTRCSTPHPKPVRAHHCSTCRTCVMDMDHHCPFVSAGLRRLKCVQRE